MTSPGDYARLVVQNAKASLRYGRNHPQMITLSTALDDASTLVIKDGTARKAAVEQLNIQLAIALSERERLGKKYGLAHPQMRDNTAVIAALESALDRL